MWHSNTTLVSEERWSAVLREIGTRWGDATRLTLKERIGTSDVAIDYLDVDNMPWSTAEETVAQWVVQKVDTRIGRRAQMRVRLLLFAESRYLIGRDLVALSRNPSATDDTDGGPADDPGLAAAVAVTETWAHLKGALDPLPAESPSKDDPKLLGGIFAHVQSAMASLNRLIVVQGATYEAMLRAHNIATGELLTQASAHGKLLGDELAAIRTERSDLLDKMLADRLATAELRGEAAKDAAKLELTERLASRSLDNLERAVVAWLQLREEGLADLLEPLEPLLGDDRVRRVLGDPRFAALAKDPARREQFVQFLNFILANEGAGGASTSPPPPPPPPPAS